LLDQLTDQIHQASDKKYQFAQADPRHGQADR